MIDVLYILVFKRKTKQLNAAVSSENIAGSILYEYGKELTSPFRLDTIILPLSVFSFQMIYTKNLNYGMRT